jgi:uncharacterized membrane protein YbhN (UPF0104 family)
LNQCCGSDHFSEYQRYNQISHFSGAKLAFYPGHLTVLIFKIEVKISFSMELIMWPHRFHEFTLVRQIWFAIIGMFFEFVEINTPKVSVFLFKSEDHNTIKP